MTTQTTQVERQTRRATLKLKGPLLSIDAQILEEACRSLSAQRRKVTINLAHIDFLTDGAAEILCRLKHYRGIALEEMNLLVQQVMQRQEAALNIAK